MDECGILSLISSGYDTCTDDLFSFVSSHRNLFHSERIRINCSLTNRFNVKLNNLHVSVPSS